MGGQVIQHVGGPGMYGNNNNNNLITITNQMKNNQFWGGEGANLYCSTIRECRFSSQYYYYSFRRSLHTSL